MKHAIRYKRKYKACAQIQNQKQAHYYHLTQLGTERQVGRALVDIERCSTVNLST